MEPVELLLVEDNPGDVLLIRQVLNDALFPVKVHVALDGEQALQMLENRHFQPDLVILDLNIPKVPGLSFLSRCRLDKPIVVFSSSSSPDDRQRAFDLGAKAFIQKPSDLAAFAQQVSQIVREWGHPQGRGATTT